MALHSNGRMSGEAYAGLRKDLRYTQQELATALGVATSTISKRERGELAISAEAELAIRHLRHIVENVGA